MTTLEHLEADRKVRERRAKRLAQAAFKAQFEPIAPPPSCSCSRGGNALFCECKTPTQTLSQEQK